MDVSTYGVDWKALVSITMADKTTIRKSVWSGQGGRTMFVAGNEISPKSFAVVTLFFPSGA